MLIFKVAEFDWIKSNQIKSNQIESKQIKSNQIKSNQIESNRIKSNQMKSNQIKSNQNLKKLSILSFSNLNDDKMNLHRCLVISFLLSVITFLPEYYLSLSISNPVSREVFSLRVHSIKSGLEFSFRLSVSRQPHDIFWTGARAVDQGTKNASLDMFCAISSVKNQAISKSPFQKWQGAVAP